LHEDYGYESPRFLNRDELQTHVRSDLYLAGLLDPRSGHLHPLKYTQGLASAAEREGVRIYENSQVIKYVSGAPTGDVVVHTASGQLTCKHLVLCANAYINGLAPPLSRRILGVGTYIIATEPLAPSRAATLIPSNAAIADINWILDYFRLTADHRLLFGGRVSYSAMDPPRLSESMRRRMVRVFPELHDVKVDYTWGGYLDITMSRAPDFGRLAPNVFICKASPATACPSRASGASSSPKPSPAPPNVSMCSPAFRTATSPAASCCAGPRWYWPCSTTGCAICCSSARGCATICGAPRSNDESSHSARNPSEWSRR
jgi:hypothetical protein